MKFSFSTWARAKEAYAYRHEPEYLRTLAEDYWRAVLGTFVLLVVCATAYGAFLLFSALTAEGASALVSGGKEATLDRARLEATLSGFAERKTNYQFQKANPPKVTDPSK